MGFIFHTMATPELDPIGALRLASRLRFDGLELICQEGYPCGVSPLSDPAAVARIAGAAADFGVPVVVLSSYEKRYAHTDRDVRGRALDALRRELDMAGRLSASAVRLLAGEESPAHRWAEDLPRLADSLRNLAGEAADRGVRVLVENHMDTMATSATATMAICSAVRHDNLSILFDPANLATLHAEGFLESFELQRPLIGHVHVKDAVLVDGARRSVMPGEGTDPWPALISALRGSGYGGHYALEYERRWIPDLPPAELALPKAKAFLERCLELSAAAGAPSPGKE